MKRVKSKIFIGQYDWHKVYEALEDETIKTTIYDDLILSQMDIVKDKRILDYGCGPGIISHALEEKEADIDIFDINKRILKIARKRVLEKHIIYEADNISENTYDLVLCNLVLCIVEDEEVPKILKNIYNALKYKGIAYIGFCNPKIFKVRETKLDIRHFTGEKYKDNHTYLKEKKEGGYLIPEKHRPTEWYIGMFIKAGFKVEKKFYTSPHFFKGKKIKDFVIFKLIK